MPQHIFEKHHIHNLIIVHWVPVRWQAQHRTLNCKEKSKYNLEQKQNGK